MIARGKRLARRLLRAGEPAAELPAVSTAQLELERSGPVPLAPRPAVRADSRDPLRIAIVIPSFRRGGGGHATIVNLARALAERGHTLSLWLEDFQLLHTRDPPELTRRRFAEWFPAAGLELHTDFSRWRGADVVVATGWQTVARTLLLDGVGARAYLVQDHEPEFYATSAEALLAARTYRYGLHCIAASPWLAGLLRERYGASASHFDLAVDHSLYHPADVGRRAHQVAFYARLSTGRRAVPLGLLALEELSRRRPQVEIVLFGNDLAVPARFPYTALGVLDFAGLAELYRSATLGLVFSLTNPSLIGLEMMACGLPCIDLASEAMLATFGADGPLELAEPEALRICSTIETLLDDRALRTRLADQGLALARQRTWSRAGEELEQGLRHALARSA